MSKLKTKTLALVALALLVILIVLGGLFFYFSGKFNSQKSLLPNLQGKTIGISFGYLPVGVLFSVPTTSATSTPSIFTVSKTSKDQVLSIAGDASTTYYLILSSDQLSSNLFVSLTKDTTRTLTQLTNSPTLKFNLSYDPGSHMLAYQDVSIKSAIQLRENPQWKISTFNIFTRKESTLTSGTNPQLVAGGQYLFYMSTSSIDAMATLASSSPRNILGNSPYNTAYAYNPQTKTIAIYNPSTKEIDFYDVSEVTSVSYLHSTPTSFYPTAMTYDGTVLLIAGPIQGDIKHSLLQEVGYDKILTLINPVAAYIPQSMTILPPAP